MERINWGWPDEALGNIFPMWAGGKRCPQWKGKIWKTG